MRDSVALPHETRQGGTKAAATGVVRQNKDDLRRATFWVLGSFCLEVFASSQCYLYLKDLTHSLLTVLMILRSR